MLKSVVSTSLETLVSHATIDENLVHDTALSQAVVVVPIECIESNMAAVDTAGELSTVWDVNSDRAGTRMYWDARLPVEESLQFHSQPAPNTLY